MSIGKAVIRPLKDALDDMPVHVRQLSEMFRRHGQKQNRNTSGVSDLDATDVPSPLQNGWKPDGWTPNDVLGAGKGGRPDPGDYLDGDYVRDHLDQFAEGATRFYRKGSLDDWGPGNNGTTYVFPTDQLQNVIDRSATPQDLANTLGLPENFFDGADVELRDFAPHELDGLRMPSGNEGGTDVDKWIPGGYLPSGIPEAVIDIPETSTGLKNGEFRPTNWPGSPRDFTFGAR
ncbi:hypothetical protein [Microbacterium sp.]|uniref:hypothetical protein n=1 Tax=Microbacterium sp. TaxID=51671 RepID=UPI003F727C6C